MSRLAGQLRLHLYHCMHQNLQSIALIKIIANINIIASIKAIKSIVFSNIIIIIRLTCNINSGKDIGAGQREFLKLVPSHLSPGAVFWQILPFRFFFILATCSYFS